MSTFITPLSSLPALTVSDQIGIGAGSAASKSGGFQQALVQVTQHTTVQAKKGDTLIGLVKTHYKAGSHPLSDAQAMRLAQQVAASNGIDNPDLILPGQKIHLQDLKNTASLPTTRGALNLNARVSQQIWQLNQTTPSANLTAHALASRPAQWTSNDTGKEAHTVLDRTLSRAVDKGFVQASEVPAAKSKILALADRYNFQPDDFARLTLMESGGMNPQASNGKCHGIIQFCDGSNRGAASVGLKDNPRAILGMGLLQQLDLVERYFGQAGLRVKGPPLGLDDLYLTVLTPAARKETRTDAPLAIAGPQTRYLHIGQDTRNPITRNSILSGLHQLTQKLLGPMPQLAQGSSTPAPAKVHLARLYDEVAKTQTLEQR
jgi:hypothetical protein